MSKIQHEKEWIAAMGKLPALTDDIDHYRKAFLACKPVLQKELIFDAITEYFDSNVVEKLTSVPAKKQFSMLAVGLGEGKHELHMLKKLSRHFTSIRVIAVDPNKGMLQTFCESLNSCDDTKNVKCNAFEGAYFEFLESPMADVKFDLITSIHSMYYLGGLTKAVESMLSSLDPVGIMLVDVLSDDSYFAIRFGRERWLIERTSWRLAPVKSIRHLAEKNGHKITIHRIPVTYHLSSLLDETSVEGNLQLDLFTMTPNFRRDAPPDIVEDVLTFMRENLIHVDDQGRPTACGDDSLLIISK